MKISEMIYELVRIKENFGDIDVKLWSNGAWFDPCLSVESHHSVDNIVEISYL